MHEQALIKEVNGGQSPNKLTKKWALVAILCSLPLFFLFAYLGDPGRGRAASICAAVILTAIRARWDSRKHGWFWITIAIVVFLHVPLVLLIPWTNKSMPGITLLPIAFLDYAIVYGCIKLVEKAMKRA
jgi:hypothetical protein